MLGYIQDQIPGVLLRTANRVRRSRWFFTRGTSTPESKPYGDMIPDSEERRAKIDPVRIRYPESVRDVKWIVYMEFQDAPGHFVELFNTLDATEPRVPEEHRDLNYTHFAHVVDDVQAFYEEVLQKGGKDSVYLPPMPNIDRTFAFWLQDPDENRMEFIQYTDMSMEIIGREMPGGLTLSEFFDRYTKK